MIIGRCLFPIIQGRGQYLGNISHLGSATHTIGSHSRMLSPDVFWYNGWDQILLERVCQSTSTCQSSMVFYCCLFTNSLLRLQFSFLVMQVAALATIKLSNLFLYRHISIGEVFNIISWILIGLVLAWGVVFFLTPFAWCGSNFGADFQRLADLRRGCVDTFKVLTALAASDVAADLAILVAPIPLVGKTYSWIYSSEYSLQLTKQAFHVAYAIAA